MSVYMGRNETSSAVMEALEVLRKYPFQWITYNPNDPLANSVVTYLKKQGKVTVNRFHQFQAKHKSNPGKKRASKRNPSGNRSDVRSPTSTRTEVRSPTRTSTDVRSPTSTRTSTRALTSGNITVTGGAGAGATTVNLRPGGGSSGKRVTPISMSGNDTADAGQSGDSLGGRKKNPSRKGAPGIRERSNKLHKIRKVFVKDMNAGNAGNVGNAGKRKSTRTGK